MLSESGISLSFPEDAAEYAVGDIPYFFLNIREK